MTGVQHNVRHGLPNLSQDLNSFPYLASLFTSNGFNVVDGRVASWVSVNGNSTFAQTTESKRPAYEAAGWDGKPSVKFDLETAIRYLTNTGMATAMSGTATPFTLIIVMEIHRTIVNLERPWHAADSGSNYTMAYFSSGSTPANRMVYRRVITSSVIIPSPATSAGWAPASGKRLAMSWSFNGTSGRVRFIYLDQVLDSGLVSMPAGAVTFNRLALGAHADGTSGNFPMRVPEILFFSQALVAPHDTKLFNILRTRWNLSNL